MDIIDGAIIEKHNIESQVEVITWEFLSIIIM